MYFAMNWRRSASTAACVSKHPALNHVTVTAKSVCSLMVYVPMASPSSSSTRLRACSNRALRLQHVGGVYDGNDVAAGAVRERIGTVSPSA
jgi:hypothetical protein